MRHRDLVNVAVAAAVVVWWAVEARQERRRRSSPPRPRTRLPRGYQGPLTPVRDGWLTLPDRWE